MRRVWPVVGLFAVALAVASSGPRAQEPQRAPAFRSGATAVAVDVNVRDRSGRPITGLDVADFEVLDNGVRQDVVQLSYGKVPIDITVALDVSYSVVGHLLDRLRDAVGQLMRDLGSEDRLKLVLFNMRVTRTTDFTTDVKLVDQAIRSAVAGGGTAFHDAVSVALVSAAAPDRRQLVVFFTDARDSVSTSTPEMIVKVAERTRATLTFVTPAAVGTTAFGARAAAGSPPPVPNVLARETGGSVLPFSDATNLTATFRRILNDFRSTYVLYYNARGVDQTGYHTIDVKVSRSNAVVTARRGYQGGQ
ncbi:MAG TPA: VWA domain-containing protein [Vicinamibacterales bacterium]|nr:VWA domain-containing protein [Vicinamibacterales bacterium]